MIALVAGLMLVPVVDQSLKLLVLRGLAPASMPLGPLGKLQVVSSRIWLVRPRFRPHLGTTWSLWCFAAGSLVVLSGWFPSCGWYAGALVGGSLSHILETSLRGRVIDYVCLRFWPAFNLADVAITIGACGVLAQLTLTLKEGW